ncbi:MAG: PQQ-binding-like beta-propeller repeat protein, partial [Planctomycetota bacterium]
MQLKIRVRLALATFGVLLLLMQFNAAADTTKIPWQMFRADIRHTGQSDYKGGQTNALKWSYKIETRVTSSPSVGRDGVIYFGSIDGRLYAVNPDGSTKWAFQVGNEITASPAIGEDGTIYIGCR